MFRAILETQWKWTRGVVLAATLAGFAVPIASLQAAHANAESSQIQFVTTMQLWGAAYAVLAAALGLFVAFAAWSNDHRGRHVYALSLPITRARYALMRFGAGATFLAPTVIAVFAACVLVSTLGGIPEGLRTYPVAVTLRFAFAALVAYALFFAVASSTQKAAGILLAVLAAILLAQYGLELAEVRVDIVGRLMSLLLESPGVFSVFTGRWTLIDA
jgi:hypothetical protein